MSAQAGRPPIFGPEPSVQLPGRSWPHFDRWFALVAVHDAGSALDRYVDTARLLGSDQGRPIVALAESALERGDRTWPLRCSPPRTSSGGHRKYLRERSASLTGGSPPDGG